MVKKPTWILLAILVVIVGVTFFLESKDIRYSQETPTPTPGVMLFASGLTENLARIEYTASGAEPIVLAKDASNQWSFANLQADPVNQGTVLSALSNLAAAQVQSEVALDTDPAFTGMNQPTATLTLTEVTGTVHTLKIGQLTPVGNGYYCMIEGDVTLKILNRYTIEDVMSALSMESLTAPAIQ